MSAMRLRVSGAWVVTAVLVIACGAGAALAACSSAQPVESNPDSSTDAPPVACTQSDALKIQFAPMYSAFITDSASHTFQVPVSVTGGTGEPSWSASDPTVSFSPGTLPGETLITVKSAASPITINVRVGALCNATQLNVTSAVEADWQEGNQRYNNGVPVYPGCIGAKVAPLLADSGFVLPPPPEAGCPDAGPACTGCHGNNPTGGFFQGVQHTPEQTGGFSDQQLVAIFTRAEDPNYDTAYLPYEYWHAFHTWTDIDTPQKQKGMVVYLRSLSPTGDPDAGLTGDY